MKKTFGRTGSWIDADFDDDFSSSFTASPPASKAATTFATPTDSLRKRKNVESNKTGHVRILRENDVQLWVDRHQPTTVSDLAVHPKKIEEIKFWLQQHVVKSSKKKGILLLTGPPGCGKTATIKALSHNLKLGVQEWQNPTDTIDFVPRSDQPYSFTDPSDNVPFVSQANAFRTFMLRANRYKVLSGLMEDADPSCDSGQKIVLIEDLPSFAFRKKEEFQDILVKYQRSTRSFPLVIIQSESQKEDTIKNIFPPELIQTLNIQHIQMNAVAPTNLVKALSAIATYESAQGVRRFSVPDKQALAALATSSSGDIRGAINALQFACLNDIKGDFRSAFEGQSSLGPSNKKKVKNLPKIKGSASEDSVLASIGGKDPSLDLFHAMGKVLYCKREESESSSDAKFLPRHLVTRSRRKLLINPEELLDNVTMSESSFVSFLHQNYVEFFTSIPSLAEAAEYLSISEPFFHEWTSTGKINLTDYGGSLAVRGLCQSNTGVRQSSGMRNFSKPEWFATVKKAQKRRDTLSHFSQTRCLSHTEMATIFIPYLSKCYGSCLPKEVADIGLFPGSVPLNTAQAQNFVLNQVQQDDEEETENFGEDLIIEEFD